MAKEDKVNILMVDDQPAKLLSYEVILGELDENLIKVTSGKEALEYLLKNDTAVVLMDVSMPEIDGFELAEMIRQHPRFQKTAIIFISAVHLTDLDRLKGYQRGAVDYISVPVVPELLRAKVSVFAELHRRAGQLQNLNSELRRLSVRLITMQDEERRRIARELHDGLGQELVAAKMLLHRAVQQNSEAVRKEAASDAAGIIDRSIQQVRSMSHLLHPPLLDEVGLVSALRWYLEGFTQRSGIETTLDVNPLDFSRLTPELETAIFRIIQESLSNVLRHSKARKAWVTLGLKDGQVVAKVRDDGRGIERRVAEQQPGSVGVGISGMSQRAREFGGELRLVLANPGTLVEMVLPCKTPTRQDACATVDAGAPLAIT
ncbi:MAG TPA: response regulator [Terriglobales bacterium]|jgi:signal transduction histidine kinase|nr:response regulator [Terriglobales bacterium]